MKTSTSSRRSSSRSNSSNPSSGNNRNNSESLKTPDSHVGYLITDAIDRKLPAVTPLTNLHCDIYGNAVYFNGNIILWHVA